MAKKLQLTDTTGIPWLIYEAPDDALWPMLRQAKLGGFPIDQLVLPPELPRHLRIDDPDWSQVLQLWQTEGDTPRLRQELTTNYFREVMNSDTVDTKCLSRLDPKADDAGRVA